MRRKENLSVIKKPGDKSKIYCYEPYAQELYNLMYGHTESVKDIKNGDLLRVVSLKFINDDEVEVLCDNHDTLYFLAKKEKKFIEILGMTPEIFKDWVTTQDCLDYFKKYKIYIEVENARIRKGSLHAAHLQTIAEEFREQITNPTRAYIAKILTKNQGGFLVEVQGIKAFLPGSLAAANKIVNFDDYIGKQIYVMIEDYLSSSNIFVVSYKKYLDNILPSKLGELERDQYMEGTVTGTSKFGVFVEFNEIFTGLLHVSEMSTTTLNKFNNGEIKSGNSMSVWIKDIRDNKLILTETDPSIRKNEMEEFKGKIEGNFTEATIVSVKPHGALMEVKKGVLGLLPVKEMKKSGRRLSVGESLQVFIKRVDVSTGKIYLTLSDECITAEI